MAKKKRLPNSTKPHKRLAPDAKVITKKLTAVDKKRRNEIAAAVEKEIPPKPVSAARVALAKLKDARKMAAISLDQLAERTGMSKPNLSRIENGSGNVTVQTLERYAKGIGAQLQISIAPYAAPKKKPAKKVARSK
ncbi:MAG: hypothetical protein CMJ64_09775 [Planctomycetaceae bacterium]|nr:hypothetical protein [Planctomycetaceae bacterium]